MSLRRSSGGGRSQPARGSSAQWSLYRSCPWSASSSGSVTSEAAGNLQSRKISVQAPDKCPRSGGSGILSALGGWKRGYGSLCLCCAQHLGVKGHKVTPSSLRRMIRSCCVRSGEMARPASMSSSSSSTRSRVVCMPIGELCTLPAMTPSEVNLLLWTRQAYAYPPSACHHKPLGINSASASEPIAPRKHRHNAGGCE